MTVTQQQRHLMIDRLAASIGDEATGILMEFLPQWAGRTLRPSATSTRSSGVRR